MKTASTQLALPAGRFEAVRRLRVRGVRAAFWLALLAAPIALLGGGQCARAQVILRDPSSPQPATPPRPDVNEGMGGGTGISIYQERRLRQLNAAQHRSMVSDTDKLLKLVKELNDEIGKSKPKELSSEQLRKVAKIEKLAHSIRDKMSNAVQPAVFFFSDSPSIRIR